MPILGPRKCFEDEEVIKEIEKGPEVRRRLGRMVSGKSKEVSIATTVVKIIAALVDHLCVSGTCHLNYTG